jgi:polar amino acid transport system substrate-binding protein
VKRLSLGIALVLLATACGGDSSTGSALARVRASGVLRWGGDVQGGEPYAFEDPSHPGRLVGFEVELADAIARELHVRARFVQNDWSNLVPSLDRGSFDIALNGLEVTPARSGSVTFTRPYYIFTEYLVVRADETRIHSLSDLQGRHVGTLASSLAWDMLRNVGADVVPYEGVEEPFQDLEHGRTDAVVLDDIIATRYGLNRPTLKLAAQVGDGYYSIATRQNDTDLARAIDQALARITRSGELRRILARSHIDSEKQARLATWTDQDTRDLVGTHSASHMSGAHVWLFIEGAGTTLLVSTAAMLLAITLGLGLALTRRYAPRPVALLAQVYVELFRGTPVLLQLYVIYFGLSNLSPHLQLAALPAAILGLGLNYAAYESEIYRAGMDAVPQGQMDAAAALNMSQWLALRRILIPQALRVALPGVTNDFIALLKDSSLVSVITVVELTKRMTITAVDVRSWFLPGLLCAGLYLAMSYPLSRLSSYLEKRLQGEP